jgi:3-dehydroshikimate dehydratase
MTMNSTFTLCISTIALRNQPIAKALDIVAAAGFPGVEIWYAHIEKMSDEEIREVARQCEKLKLKVEVVSPYFAFTRGEEWRKTSIATAGRALSAARILGAGKIRTFVDIGPDGMPSARATEADWSAAIAGLRELCDLDPHVQFVVETHPNTLADSLDTVQRLLRETERPNLKLNFQVNPDFLQRGWRKCLEVLYPDVVHMHWSQETEGGHGDGYVENPGLVDFAQWINYLREKRYAGSASVEYCWADADPARVATAYQFLASLMNASKAG